MLKNKDVKEVWEHTKVYVKEVYLQKIIKSNLSNGATKLLLVLQGHKNSETGLCNPSQELLAQECNGVSVRTIQRWLKELKEKAFIVIKRMGKMITNEYTLKVDEELEQFKKQYNKDKETEKKAKNVAKKIENKCNSYIKSPKKNKLVDKFCDYNQRSYDWEELEKKLLGWD